MVALHYRDRTNRPPDVVYCDTSFLFDAFVAVMSVVTLFDGDRIRQFEGWPREAPQL